MGLCACHDSTYACRRGRILAVGFMMLIAFYGVSVTAADRVNIGYEVAQTLQDCMAGRKLGAKSGVGFYTYAARRAVPQVPALGGRDNTNVEDIPVA